MPERRERDYLRRLAGGAAAADTVREVLGDASARRYHAVRRMLAAHPATPRSEALALIPTLFWRDLAWISTEVRAHPAIRRAADREILKRLPGLALSEKRELAGCAGRGVIAALRQESEPRLAQALLRNRMTTEPDVVSIAIGSRSPELLAIIAGDLVWGKRSPVLAAVALNRRAPEDLVEALISRIPIDDVRELASDAARPFSLRRRARAELRFRVERAPRVD
jgi:hypothetical protein